MASNYVPVWLTEDQLNIALDGVFSLAQDIGPSEPLSQVSEVFEDAIGWAENQTA